MFRLSLIFALGALLSDLVINSMQVGTSGVEYYALGAARFALIVSFGTLLALPFYRNEQMRFSIGAGVAVAWALGIFVYWAAAPNHASSLFGFNISVADMPVLLFLIPKLAIAIAVIAVVEYFYQERRQMLRLN